MPVTITLAEQRAFKIFMKHPGSSIGCSRQADPHRWELYMSLAQKSYIKYVDTFEGTDYFELNQD